MKKFVIFLIFLNLSICSAQNIRDTIIIPIGVNDKREPIIFYDNEISDTLKANIVVKVRLNASLGDTLVNLIATDIHVEFFRLTGSQHTNCPFYLRIVPSLSHLSELDTEELRLYKTYSEKMINLYWKQPYNRLKDDITNYGNVSGIVFGCPFVVVPKK